jgi:hypothetical protein
VRCALHRGSSEWAGDSRPYRGRSLRRDGKRLVSDLSRHRQRQRVLLGALPQRTQGVGHDAGPAHQKHAEGEKGFAAAGQRGPGPGAVSQEPWDRRTLTSSSATDSTSCWQPPRSAACPLRPSHATTTRCATCSRQQGGEPSSLISQRPCCPNGSAKCWIAPTCWATWWDRSSRRASGSAGRHRPDVVRQTLTPPHVIRGRSSWRCAKVVPTTIPIPVSGASTEIV